MKLIRRTAQGRTFLLQPSERHLLDRLIELYPIIDLSYHTLSWTGDPLKLAEEQKLLEDSLATHKQDNKAELKKLLGNSHRFRKADGGVKVSLTLPEIEQLLQVLNDVRVGSWIKVGKPQPDQAPNIDPDTLIYIWAMEVSGYYQHRLLAALEAPPSRQRRSRKKS